MICCDYVHYMIKVMGIIDLGESDMILITKTISVIVKTIVSNITLSQIGPKGTIKHTKKHFN
jgi:hypothetical protein